MINKFKKIFKFLVSTNIWQTWCLYRRVKHPRSAHLHVCHWSKINLAKTATIDLPEHGFLDINVLNIKRKRVTPCTLWLDENSCLTSKGFSMYEGAAICVLKNGRLTLGKNSYMNMSLIQCANSITIGDDCAIAGDVLIQDTDFHPILDSEGNPKSISKPIHIGNHVWICAKATILKGVTIGDGSIVAAGAIVTKDVPAHCLVAGNPAKVIRENVFWGGGNFLSIN